jgi:hypothetical protein
VLRERRRARALNSRFIANEKKEKSRRTILSRCAEGLFGIGSGATAPERLFLNEFLHAGLFRSFAGGGIRHFLRRRIFFGVAFTNSSTSMYSSARSSESVIRGAMLPLLLQTKRRSQGCIHAA